MAITVCSELKEAVAKWLARVADTQITGNVGDFITLAEGHLNRNLLHPRMETVQTITTTSGSANVADGYLAWKRMTWLGDLYRSLSYVTPEMFNYWHPGLDAGTPAHFTIEGSNIYIRPTDDTTSYEFLYYSKLSALEDDGDSNWLLTSYPDLYLAATMAEANAFLLNPDHAALWASKRDTIIAQLNRMNEPQGPSQMRPHGVII